MLISNAEPRFVFIHIQKTGGVTVSELLAKTVPEATSHRPRHMFARKALKRVNNAESYFKFAFVRNPWDRIVSWYAMIDEARKLLSSPDAPPVPRRRFRHNPLYKYVLKNGPTFEDFLRNCTQKRRVQDGFYSFAFNQLNYLTDRDGTLLVDFIGRFERFAEDLEHVFSTLGLDLGEIPHRNYTERPHYSHFYTPETEELVRKRYRRDIEYFGYEFEREEADTRFTIY